MLLFKLKTLIFGSTLYEIMEVEQRKFPINEYVNWRYECPHYYFQNIDEPPFDCAYWHCGLCWNGIVHRYKLKQEVMN